VPKIEATSDMIVLRTYTRTHTYARTCALITTTASPLPRHPHPKSNVRARSPPPCEGTNGFRHATPFPTLPATPDRQCDSPPPKKQVAAAGMVVNTLGWVDGLGYDLLLHVIASLRVRSG
jgi:hypothetical protein